MRDPGAMTLEKESMRMTRPSVSRERKEGTSLARNSAWDEGGVMGVLAVVYGSIWRK